MAGYSTEVARKGPPVRATEPLPLHHSWPIFEPGRLLDDVGFDPLASMPAGVGAWSCELATQALDWSPAVYDVFGLPRDARVTRAATLALYGEESRAAMERLRSYAIRHRRGFTLDARIRPDQPGERWMRLTALPVLDGAEVVRLQGYKRIVSLRAP